MKTQQAQRRTRWQIICLLVAVVTATILPTAYAADGDLDTTFATPNGFATLADGAFFDVAIQSGDGKIVAVGQQGLGLASALVVARFNTDGTPDSSFGTGGVARAVAPFPTRGVAIALQPDGKIVAAGGIFISNVADNFFLTRFEANGSLDTSFGQSGSVAIAFSNLDETSFASGVAIGPNGTIALAGTSLFDITEHVALARLNSNGSLDASFGTGGKVATEIGDALDVAVRSDGRILVAGRIIFVGQLCEVQQCTDFAVWGYNSNGTLDTSFGGGDGIATAGFPSMHAGATSMALQQDGKIVLAGGLRGALGGDLLARFDSNGNLDPSFGTDGKVTGTIVGDGVSSEGVALQADGRIVTVGNAVFGGGSTERIILSRYLSDGSPDPSFGSGGKVITDPLLSQIGQQSYGLAIQSDGKIVVVAIDVFVNPHATGIVARYNGSVGPPPPPPPPPPPSFDICVQNGSRIFRFNSTTGAYDFHDCSKGFVLSGTGTITVNSCKLELRSSGAEKNSGIDVLVKVNTCTKAGTVSVMTTSPPKSYGYTDNDISTGSCTCP